MKKQKRFLFGMDGTSRLWEVNIMKRMSASSTVEERNMSKSEMAHRRRWGCPLVAPGQRSIRFWEETSSLDQV